jgi:hypothetical protein
MPILFAIFGRIVGMIPWQAWVGLIAVIAIGVGLHMYSAEIKRAAFDRFYAAEVQQNLVEKQHEIDLLIADVAARDAALKALNARTVDLARRSDALAMELKTKKDAPAAEVLRYTVDQIRPKVNP